MLKKYVKFFEDDKTLQKGSPWKKEKLKNNSYLPRIKIEPELNTPLMKKGICPSKNLTFLPQNF